MLKILIKYGLVGILNTIIDYGLFQLIVLAFSFHAPLTLFFTSFFSGSLAVINSFFWNKRWTFRDKATNRMQQFTRFVGINIISIALNSTLVALLELLFKGHIMLVGHEYRSVYLTKGVAVIFTMVINFAAYRFFVFKKQTEEYTVS